MRVTPESETNVKPKRRKTKASRSHSEDPKAELWSQEGFAEGAKRHKEEMGAERSTGSGLGKEMLEERTRETEGGEGKTGEGEARTGEKTSGEESSVKK